MLTDIYSFLKNIPQGFEVVIDEEALVHILKLKEAKASGHYCKDFNGRLKLLFKHNGVKRTDIIFDCYFNECLKQ